MILFVCYFYYFLSEKIKILSNIWICLFLIYISDLKFELHAGQLPLNRLTKKAKELIQNAFQSNVIDVHEVAWPHEKIAGERGQKLILFRLQKEKLHIKSIFIELFCTVTKCFYFRESNHINTNDRIKVKCCCSISHSGIMNYGSLLTTNKEGMFLLRVVQNHIHLVEITDDVMRTYDMEKLMLLPSQNKNETLRKYLHKISVTIKVSLLFC